MRALTKTNGSFDADAIRDQGPSKRALGPDCIESERARRRQCVLVAVTFLALMSVTLSSAAPREIEDFCFKQAQQVRLEVRRGAWEAFMTNCVANLTPTPTTKRKSRKY